MMVDSLMLKKSADDHVLDLRKVKKQKISPTLAKPIKIIETILRY